MPITVPVPTKNPGDVITSSLWNSYVRDNVNKLLNLGHRVVTVAQFAALTGLEDGDEVYLAVDATTGVYWHLRYVAAAATKWQFLGGVPLYSFVASLEFTTSTAYAALGTAGPSIVLPRAGDYIVDHGVRLFGNVGARDVFMSYDIGGTTAVDADAVVHWTAAINSFSAGHNASRRRLKTGLGAVTLTAKYKSGNVDNQANYEQRWMSVVPVRIS